MPTGLKGAEGNPEPDDGKGVTTNQVPPPLADVAVEIQAGTGDWKWEAINEGVSQEADVSEEGSTDPHIFFILLT